MIQFNLLPDVKKQYVRAKRTKRLIFTFSTVASIVAVGVTVLMFTFVHVGQKKHITDLTKDVKTTTEKIKSIENLDNVLTVQNQLSLLPGLHREKPELSRIFDYITFVSPKTISVGSVDVDTEQLTLKISGIADSIATVNKLADNIKATTFGIVGAPDEGQKPFSGVTTDISGSNEGATFEVTMSYDSSIFNNYEEVVMRIGTNFTSTDDSTVESPGGGQ